MIVHIVLLEPRPELTLEQRRGALTRLAGATAAIPEIRRFRIGRRVTHGLLGYEQLAERTYAFALLLEFDSVDDLARYLRAPAHGALGDLFTTATAHALACDYEVVEGEALGELVNW